MDAINAFFTFAIPGSVIAAIVWNWAKKNNIHLPILTMAQPVGDTEAAVALPSDGRTVSMADWMAYVNTQPENVPHLAIIGPTGAGKTTTATAVLTGRRGQIVILSAKEGDYWGGIEYIGIDDDLSYNRVKQVAEELYLEIKRRNLALRQRNLTSEYLTIVIDDFSTLVNEAPVIKEVVKFAARIGRALRVRLIMLSDSALVKALGLEGEGETRAHFAFIRLARGHTGTIDIDGEEPARLPIETEGLRELAWRAHLMERSWLTLVEEDDNDFLERSLELRQSVVEDRITTHPIPRENGHFTLPNADNNNNNVGSNADNNADITLRRYNEVLSRLVIGEAQQSIATSVGVSLGTVNSISKVLRNNG